jgi:hypothetical protein
MIRFLIPFAVCLAFTLPASACNYPDEGNMPLRRAVSKVKFLPETRAWADAMHKEGNVVQYALLLEQSIRRNGRCYWPVEVRSGSELWRRYYVTPDGKQLLRSGGAAPPASRPPREATAAARRSRGAE